MCHSLKTVSSTRYNLERFCFFMQLNTVLYYKIIVQDNFKKFGIIHYHCRLAMICRDDLELRWQLLMCENDFSHIIIFILTISVVAAILALSAPSTVQESAGSFLATITLTNTGLTSALHVDILDAEKTATKSGTETFNALDLCYSVTSVNWTTL